MPLLQLSLLELRGNSEVERVLCDCVDHPMLVMAVLGPFDVLLDGQLRGYLFVI